MNIFFWWIKIISLSLCSKPQNMYTIQFTPQLYKELKSAYKKAVETKKEQFVFNGHEFLTNYAKYVLEYLGQYFEKK